MGYLMSSNGTSCGSGNDGGSASGPIIQVNPGDHVVLQSGMRYFYMQEITSLDQIDIDASQLSLGGEAEVVFRTPDEDFEYEYWLIPGVPIAYSGGME